MQKRLYEEAQAESEKAQHYPGSAVFVQANVAATNAVSGQTEAARRGLEAIQGLAQRQYVPAIYLAAIHTPLAAQRQAT